MLVALAFYVFFSYVATIFIIGPEDRGTIYNILAGIMWFLSPVSFPIALYLKVASK